MEDSEYRDGSRKWARDTLLIHAGEHIDQLHGSVTVPIYETASFAHRSLADHQDASDHPSDRSYYSRGYNPTVRALEEKVAALEGAGATLAFGSGMAAISTTLLVVLRGAGHLICTDKVFVTTRRWLDQEAAGLGISVSYVDTSDPGAIRAAVLPTTRAIFVEAFSNPLLEVADLRLLKQLCDSLGLLLLVDNTFLSPYLLQPLGLGADLVIHSATKYISGHGQVLGGVVSGSRDLVATIAEPRRLFGATLTPHSAALILAGVKTLGLRMERASQNGLATARLLADHPEVRRVYYPGLETDPGHILAKSLTGGLCAGIVTFELVDHARTAGIFYDALQLMTRATSLGDCATLCEAMEDPDVIRIACGIEATEDLCWDLTQALGKVSTHQAANRTSAPPN